MKGSTIRRHIAIWPACFVVANIVGSILWWSAAAKRYPPIDVVQFCAEQQSPVGIVLFYTDDDVFRASRLSTAAGVSKSCPRAFVFAVGGARPHLGYYGAEAMATQLEARAVDHSRILIDHQSFDTRGNVDAAINMARQTGASTLLLVSDQLHFARIDYLFRQRDPRLILQHRPGTIDASLAQIVYRANYEGAAWLAEFIPSALRSIVLSWLRRI